ncbi:hypothetical protein PFISCL1PPCAC_23355, partial [Pristionchus fissidentatus]
CDTIVFKDKAGSLKGPFTERQIQEWYRNGWFENTTPFYFTSGVESIGEKDKPYALADLCIQNGVGSPFFHFNDNIQSEYEMKKEERAMKLDKIEKEIEESKEKCESIVALEGRLKKAEMQIEKLSNDLSGDSDF